MDNVVSLGITALDGGQTIFNDLPNNALSVNANSDLNGITLRTAISEDSCLFGGHLDTYTTASTISEKSCLFAPNPTWDYVYTDTTAGSYTWKPVVKESPVNNQLSVKIRKKIKIRCSL